MFFFRNPQQPPTERPNISDLIQVLPEENPNGKLDLSKAAEWLMRTSPKNSQAMIDTIIQVAAAQLQSIK